VSKVARIPDSAGNSIQVRRYALFSSRSLSDRFLSSAFYDNNCVQSNPSIPQCSGFGNETAIAPIVPEIEVANFTCMRSCRDKGNYINVKLINGVPKRVQCSGPNATACSW
jgi:hypothetical protein